MSQHIVQVNTSDMSRLRDWMSRPNGSLNLGRATLEAVVGGGILIRTRPYREGAPVGWQYYQDGKWWHVDDRIKDHRKNTEEAGYPIREVYAAPQPVEQLCYGCYIMKKAKLGNNAEWVAYEAPQPESDVSALVEALEACRDELRWMIERHNQQDHTDGSWLYDYQTVVEADAALAAHRKQEDRPC